MAKKILFADDNVELQAVVKTYLEKRSYEVATVGDGWNCLMKVKADRPDLLLLDLNMPKMDGMRTLQMMVSFDLMRDLPVILTTGTADRDVVLKAAHLGVVDYLIKPFETKDLLGRIEKHLVEVDVPFLWKLIDDLTPIPPKDSRFADIAEMSTGKWSAYSAHKDGRDFCVLLPKGMSEKGAGLMRPESAPALVRVYVKRGSLWRRTWPRDEKSQAA